MLNMTSYQSRGLNSPSEINTITAVIIENPLNRAEFETDKNENSNRVSFNNPDLRHTGKFKDDKPKQNKWKEFEFTIEGNAKF